MPTDDYNPLPAILKGIKVSAKDKDLLCVRIINELQQTKYAMRLAAYNMHQQVERAHQAEVKMLHEALDLAHQNHANDVKEWARGAK